MIAHSYTFYGIFIWFNVLIKLDTSMRLQSFMQMKQHSMLNGANIHYMIDARSRADQTKMQLFCGFNSSASRLGFPVNVLHNTYYSIGGKKENKNSHLIYSMECVNQSLILACLDWWYENSFFWISTYQKDNTTWKAIWRRAYKNVDYRIHFYFIDIRIKVIKINNKNRRKKNKKKQKRVALKGSRYM